MAPDGTRWLTPASPEAAATDSRSLATSLIPLLGEATGGRLGPVDWFKADWQRGGAATGTSTFKRDDGQTVPVVVKLPVGPRELTWTRRLQGDDPDPVVPCLYGSGESLGGYDLAWILIERFSHGPLGAFWHEKHVARIADAVARFHAAAGAYAVDQGPRVEPWDELVSEAMASVRTNAVPRAAQWLNALKTLRSRLASFESPWNDRPVRDWLHGDLHVANAMSRHGLEEGTVSLIDLAEVHAGHWIEDAVYLERQLWAQPQRMRPLKPIKAVADARRRLDLTVDEDYPRLAMIRRALLAATAPRFIKSEGHPRYLEACLKWLEVALGAVK